jgi:hypothetical protein
MIHLQHHNSYWVDTEIVCKRCGQRIHREILKKEPWPASETDVFSCSTVGCTWPEDHTEELKRRDAPCSGFTRGYHDGYRIDIADWPPPVEQNLK